VGLNVGITVGLFVVVGGEGENVVGGVGDLV